MIIFHYVEIAMLKKHHPLLPGFIDFNLKATCCALCNL